MVYDATGVKRPKNHGIYWHTPGCYVFIPGFFLLWFCCVGIGVFASNEHWTELLPLLIGFAGVAVVVCAVGLIICGVYLCAQRNCLDLASFKVGCRECWTCKCSKKAWRDMCACCVVRYEKKNKIGVILDAENPVIETQENGLSKENAHSQENGLSEEKAKPQENTQSQENTHLQDNEKDSPEIVHNGRIINVIPETGKDHLEHRSQSPCTEVTVVVDDQSREKSPSSSDQGNPSTQNDKDHP